jgi:hypothetical protein
VTCACGMRDARGPRRLRRSVPEPSFSSSPDKLFAVDLDRTTVCDSSPAALTASPSGRFTTRRSPFRRFVFSNFFNTLGVPLRSHSRRAGQGEAPRGRRRTLLARHGGQDGVRRDGVVHVPPDDHVPGLPPRLHAQGHRGGHPRVRVLQPVQRAAVPGGQRPARTRVRVVHLGLQRHERREQLLTRAGRVLRRLQCEREERVVSVLRQRRLRLRLRRELHVRENQVRVSGGRRARGEGREPDLLQHHGADQHRGVREHAKRRDVRAVRVRRRGGLGRGVPFVGDGGRLRERRVHRGARAVLLPRHEERVQRRGRKPDGEHGAQVRGAVRPRGVAAHVRAPRRQSGKSARVRARRGSAPSAVARAGVRRPEPGRVRGGRRVEFKGREFVPDAQRAAQTPGEGPADHRQDAVLQLPPGSRV